MGLELETQVKNSFPLSTTLEFVFLGSQGHFMEMKSSAKSISKKWQNLSIHRKNAVRTELASLMKWPGCSPSQLTGSTCLKHANFIFCSGANTSRELLKHILWLLHFPAVWFRNLSHIVKDSCLEFKTRDYSTPDFFVKPNHGAVFLQLFGSVLCNMPALVHRTQSGFGLCYWFTWKSDVA